MLFNLDFMKNTILSSFFFFILIIDLWFLIYEGITQIFSPIAELVIPIGTLIKEEKAEVETNLLIIEITIGKCSI